MSEATEQRQILDMLSDGKIGPDDAERLLARLTEIGPEHIAQPGQRLRVISHTEDGNDVDISIPLTLLATGIELEKLLPETAREAIEETGIELSELNNLRSDTLIDAIQDLEIDLSTEDGATLSIRCE
jgi:hypothetical protein